MRRTALALVLLLTAVAAAAKDPKSKSQFLDKSVVTLPESIGDYTLAEIAYDPSLWEYGVTSKWAVAGAPNDLRLTVFVYPLGRTSEEKAVVQQTADVEESLRQAVEQGTYSDLVVGERSPFQVVAPEASILDKDEKKAEEEKASGDAFDPTPKPEVKLEATDEADPFAKLIAESQPSPNSHGQRQSFRFKHNGVAMRSLGYVFYRHLFAFKVRVSVPEANLDDAAFNTLADTATRNLVPRITVENYGLCGNIEVDPGAGNEKDKDAASQAFAEQFILGVGRLKAENCAVGEGNKPSSAPAGMKRIEIVYPPNTWK